MTARLAIVGCGARKRTGTHPARDLYTGPLFRSAVADVEARGVPWLVLSAQHGLIPPDREIETYDLTIEQRRRGEQQWFGELDRRWPIGSVVQGWLAGVAGRLVTHLWFGDYVTIPIARRGEPVVVEVHAGAGYVEALHAATAGRIAPDDRPIAWNLPLQGLELGHRLGWYARRRGQLELFGAAA